MSTEEKLAMQHYRRRFLTPLTVDNLMVRLIDLMMFVENEPSIETGAMKESVVITVIERVIQSSISVDSVMEKTLISSLLPSIMDTIIQADKNSISINPKTVVGIGALLKCFSCFSYSCNK